MTHFRYLPSRDSPHPHLPLRASPTVSDSAADWRCQTEGADRPPRRVWHRILWSGLYLSDT